MNWITENICSALSDLITSIINLFGEMVNNIFYQIVEFNNKNAYAIGANKFFILLALSLAALMVVKQVLSGYILETDHDPEADPFNLIVRTAESVAVICSSSWIFDTTMNLMKKLSKDLIGSTTEIGVKEHTIKLLKIDETTLPAAVPAGFVFLLIMVIAFVVFTVVAGLRGCEAIAMKMLLPIFALDLIGTRRERWNNFFTGYMIAVFSYSIQILFYTIAMKCFVSSSWRAPWYQVAAICWLVLAIRAPKFLEKYMYVSGVSSAASGGLRLVAQSVVIKSAMK